MPQNDPLGYLQNNPFIGNRLRQLAGWMPQQAQSRWAQFLPTQAQPSLDAYRGLLDQYRARGGVAPVMGGGMPATAPRALPGISSQPGDWTPPQQVQTSSYAADPGIRTMGPGQPPQQTQPWVKTTPPPSQNPMGMKPADQLRAVASPMARQQSQVRDMVSGKAPRPPGL